MVDATIPQERCYFYVYVIFRPDGTPCYVGKGQRYRWKQHIYKSHNVRLQKIVAKAERDGLDIPIIKIREGITNQEAIETEISLIAIIGRDDLGLGPLVNLTDGGDGTTGWVQSEDTKTKISLGNLGRKVTGKALLNVISAGLLRRGKSLRLTDEGLAAKKARRGISKGEKHKENTRAMMLAGGASIRWATSKANGTDKSRYIKRAATFRAKYAERVRKEAGPWLIDPGPEYRARTVLYHEDARCMASQPVEQLSLDL